jgi:hemerythrin superfamily protein
MTSMIDRVTPSITSMIRFDHTHVVAAFHRYKSDAPPQKKHAIAQHICLAVEVHAQLEEEIFYPALRSVLSGDPVLEKSEPEHDEMRGYISRLRSSPEGSSLDADLHGLMRTVLHHVADEETQLLPAAERLLGDRLGELGAQMTRRRAQLVKPHLGEVAATGARTFQTAGAALALGGSIAIGAVLLARTRTSSSRRMQP